MKVLKIENLSIKYVKQYYSLYNFCAELNCGDKLQLVGDETSGNAFVLRAVASIDRFYSGKIKTEIDQHLIGYAPKVATLFENKSVLYNLCYPNIIRHLDENESEKIALKVLDKYGLNILADKLACNLTSEEKYIVSLLRLCVRKVDLLLVEYMPNEQSKKILDDLIANCQICLLACNQKVDFATTKTIYMQNGSIKNVE